MSGDGGAGTLVCRLWLTVDWVSGGDRTALLLHHPLDPLDTVDLVLVQPGGDQDEAVPRAVDVLVVSGKGGAGHLDVGICRAGDEAKPLHDGLSEEEKSLVPALLGEVLKETFPLVFDALRVQFYIDGTSDGVTVLAGQGEGIPWYRNNGQAVHLSLPGPVGHEVGDERPRGHAPLHPQLEGLVRSVFTCNEKLINKCSKK